MIAATAFEVGSARALVPVLKEWRKRTGEEPVFYSGPVVTRHLQGEDWPLQPVANVTEVVAQSCWPPKILLTGTSSQPEDEAFLWAEANKAGGSSVAVLDNWGGIRDRFSGPDQNSVYINTPTWIAVMDEGTRNAMIHEGCPADKIVVSGQPALDGLGTDQVDPKTLRKNLRQSESAQVLLFVCEAIRSYYGDMAEEQVGYTDESVVTGILEALKQSEYAGAEVWVKLHPWDTTDRMTPLLKAHPGLPWKVIEKGGRDWAGAANWVTGTTSILLLEAALMGRPTCAFRPGARKDSMMLQCNPSLIFETRKQANFVEWLNSHPPSSQTDKPHTVRPPAAGAVCDLLEYILQKPSSI